jgi:hypothetical protein
MPIFELPYDELGAQLSAILEKVPGVRRVDAPDQPPTGPQAAAEFAVAPRTSAGKANRRANPYADLTGTPSVNLKGALPGAGRGMVPGQSLASVPSGVQRRLR